jgi:hypothetical protein
LVTAPEAANHVVKDGIVGDRTNEEGDFINDGVYGLIISGISIDSSITIGLK